MSTQSDDYKQALEETRYIDGVEVGFTKTTGLLGGEAQRKVIQQNNLIIQLLLNLNQKVDSLKAEITVLKKGKAEAQASGSIPDDLLKRLENLSLGSKGKAVVEKKGTLRAFKDPYVILEEEKAKIKK